MTKQFVIYGLIQTEKAQFSSNRKIYIISASSSAVKSDVENFLQKQFSDIKVGSIRVCNYKASEKFFRGNKGKTKSFKKFYVTLSEGSLDLNLLKDNVSNVG